MKLRICILAGLALLTAFTAYAGGRWAVLFLIPPVFIPAFLWLLAALWVLLPCRDGGPFWKRWLLRLAALAGCLAFLWLPFFMGDGYYEMGLRAHIRSLFTPELIAELRGTVSKLSARKDEHGYVRLKATDLPPAVCATAWGTPGGASCSFDEKGGLKSVQLTWGSALISHHGLVISDEPIPFRGTGFHGGDQDMVYYTEWYYPLHPGSYIYIDEN